MSPARSICLLSLTLVALFGCTEEPSDEGSTGGATLGFPDTGDEADTTTGESSGGEASSGESGPGESSGETTGETSSGDTASETSGGQGSCGPAQVFEGQATWYELATDLVNCSYPTGTLPQFYGALNTAQYADAAMCGACARVTGPKGSVDIQIVDQCPIATNPICYEGHIDLNPPAFEQIGEIIDGIIPITWEVISCDDPGTIAYSFKEGSSQWWTGVLVRNHRNPIATFEYDTGGGNFKTVPREGYNFFVDPDGFGTGPFTFRVTDIHGHVITDVGIPLQLGDPVVGGSQFPACD